MTHWSWTFIRNISSPIWYRWGIDLDLPLPLFGQVYNMHALIWTFPHLYSDRCTICMPWFGLALTFIRTGVQYACLDLDLPLPLFGQVHNMHALIWTYPYLYSDRCTICMPWFGLTLIFSRTGVQYACLDLDWPLPLVGQVYNMHTLKNH